MQGRAFWRAFGVLLASGALAFQAGACGADELTPAADPGGSGGLGVGGGGAGEQAAGGEAIGGAAGAGEGGAPAAGGAAGEGAAAGASGGSGGAAAGKSGSGGSGGKASGGGDGGSGAMGGNSGGTSGMGGTSGGTVGTSGAAGSPAGEGGAGGADGVPPAHGDPCTDKTAVSKDRCGQPCTCSGTAWTCAPTPGGACTVVAGSQCQYGDRLCQCFDPSELACSDAKGKVGKCGDFCDPPKEDPYLCLTDKTYAPCRCEGPMFLPKLWTCP